MNNKEKKIWLDKLYYDIFKQKYNFYVCGTYTKDGVIGFTKWKTYLDAVSIMDENGESDIWKVQKFFEDINQRQITKKEIVLDLEDKKQLEPILKKLKEYGWDYELWDTGSRGYHIHIFFKEEFSVEEKESIVSYFKTDIQKCSEKCLIALEGAKHWKSGKPKILIKKVGKING